MGFEQKRTLLIRKIPPGGGPRNELLGGEALPASSPEPEAQIQFKTVAHWCHLEATSLNYRSSDLRIRKWLSGGARKTACSLALGPKEQGFKEVLC